MTVSLSTTGSNNSTGTLTSTGLGSGLDINTMVTAIVNAEIQPHQTLLQTNQTNDQATISALGVVKSALASLQSSVDAITTGGALSQLTAQTSNSAVMTATAGSGAVAGTYQVQVQTLAQANTIKSSAFSSASAAVGDGTYAITAGGKTFNVTLGSSNDTLSGFANAINNASDNSGVTATVINSSSGSYLLLSATQTGTANAVSVASSSISFTTVQDAADATGTIAGLPFDSASNIVSGVLTGVSLNLASAAPNTSQTLTISANTQAAASAVQSFVSAYNAALSLIAADTKYTPGTSSSSGTTAGTAGPLQGDVSIQSLQQQLQAVVGSSVSSGGAFTTLSQLGLSFNSDGTIAVDSTRLNSAVQQNASAVQSLFSGGGIGTQLDSLLSNYAGASGVIDSKTGVLNDAISRITSQLSDLTARQAQLTKQYYAQFNAMDSIVAGYKNTSSLLTQLYAPRTQSSSGSSG